MGVLYPIESAPYASLAGVVALVRDAGEVVRVSLTTARTDLAVRVLAAREGRGSVGFDLRDPSRASVEAVAAWARRRDASYINAHLEHGCLRVWSDDVWVDSLPSDPGIGPEIGVVEHRAAGGGWPERYHVRGVSLDVAIDLWLGTPPSDRVIVSVSEPGPSVGALLEVAAGLELDLTVAIPVDAAAALARDEPELEMVWSASMLEVALPERVATIWRLGPIADEVQREIEAHFRRFETA